jgi:hypothetical protein
MQETHDCELATHIGPESCATLAKGAYPPSTVTSGVTWF